MFDFFEEKKLTPIEKYFDDMGFFEKKQILENAIRNKPIISPFSRREIMEYAIKDAQENIFSASHGALNNNDISNVIVGTPEINPLTGKAHTEAEQRGIFEEAGHILSSGISNTINKAILGVVVVGLFYVIVNKKGKVWKKPALF